MSKIHLQLLEIRSSGLYVAFLSVAAPKNDSHENMGTWHVSAVEVRETVVLSMQTNECVNEWTVGWLKDWYAGWPLSRNLNVLDSLWLSKSNLRKNKNSVSNAVGVWFRYLSEAQIRFSGRTKRNSRSSWTTRIEYFRRLMEEQLP